MQLNLSGIGADSLPDDIAHSLPQLRTLHLDNCENLSSLPVSLGSLKALKHVFVTSGCTNLVYPPKSPQADPLKSAALLYSRCFIMLALRCTAPEGLRYCCCCPRRAFS